MASKSAYFSRDAYDTYKTAIRLRGDVSYSFIMHSTFINFIRPTKACLVSFKRTGAEIDLMDPSQFA